MGETKKVEGGGMWGGVVRQMMRNVAKEPPDEGMVSVIRVKRRAQTARL